MVLVAIGSVGFASLHTLREWQNAGFASGYRAGWVTGDPNYFSLSALLCIPLAYYLMRLRQTHWERWYCGVCLGLTLVALTAAASRGGFLGLVVMLLLAAWHSRANWKTMIAGSLVLLSLMLIAPSSPLTRIMNPRRSDLESADSRLAAWEAGLRMIRANLFTGIGAGNFKAVVRAYGNDDREVYQVAHNTYLEIAAETGLPGFAAFLGVFLGTLRTLSYVKQRALLGGPDLLYFVAEGIQTGLVGFGVGIFFVSSVAQKLFWLLVFVTMCMFTLVRDQSARRAGGNEKARRFGKGVQKHDC